MQVLVTGATGFIGGNLARQLSCRGYQVRALVRPGSKTSTIDGTGIEPFSGDILDRPSVAGAIEGCNAVFHCAAIYSFWSPDPSLVHRTNCEGTRIVLEEAQKAGVEKVVFTSTVSTIGLPERGLGAEETPLDPGHLVGHYKQSKYQAEQVALKMASRGLPVVVVNPTAPVGPWDVKPTPTGRIVLDFLLGRIPGYLNTGLNVVDVADVAAGHILALEKGLSGQRYILGHRNLSLKELLAVLSRLTGLPSPRWRVPFWAALGAGYVDQLVEGKLLRRPPRIPVEGIKIAQTPMYVTSQKAIVQLGLPQTPVEDALLRAVRWFTEHGYLVK